MNTSPRRIALAAFAAVALAASVVPTAALAQGAK